MSIKTQEEFEGLQAAGVLAHQVLSQDDQRRL
jgi:hypothetical protein